MRIISGSCRGRVLQTVTGPGYRPAMGKVRESLFSMLEARGVVWGAVRFLDVFAGSGSLGFEALSRGAVFADFIEKDRKAAVERVLQSAAACGFEAVSVIPSPIEGGDGNREFLGYFIKK